VTNVRVIADLGFVIYKMPAGLSQTSLVYLACRFYFLVSLVGSIQN